MIASTTTEDRVFPEDALVLGAAVIEQFRSVIQGQVLTPDDSEYSAAVAAWSLRVVHTPQAVVLAESTADVAAAVSFAAEHQLPVGVQATGHGSPLPCVGGVLINTSPMQGVEIDPVARTARVQAGVKWAAVVPLAHEHGLAPLCGSSSDVGVVGYTLGGGHSWLARKYGSAADRIRSAEVVTADGDILQVTAESYPDLFSALHGGGGNFGIVTSLEFELVAVDQVFGGSVIYPLEQAKTVFTAYRDWAKTLPEEVTSSIAVMRFPPLPMVPPMLQGVATVIVRACAVDDLAAGETLIAPMRTLATPILDTFGIIPFSAVDTISMDPVDPMPVAAHTQVLPELTDAAIDSLLAVVGPGCETPILLIDFRQVQEGFSSYAIGVTPNAVVLAMVETALSDLTAALAPHASDRVLLNFLSDGDVGEERTRAAYTPERFAELQAVKAKYDPENRFRFNHNIVPVAG